MQTLHPRVEAAIEALRTEILIRIASDYTSADRMELYGELDSEIINIRDKYRSLSEKEIRPECCNTRDGNKPINNESILNIYEEQKKVKKTVAFSITDTGFTVAVDGGPAPSRLLREIFETALQINNTREVHK